MHILDLNNFISLQENNENQSLYADIPYIDPCSKLPAGAQIYLQGSIDALIIDAIQSNPDIKDFVKTNLRKKLKFKSDDLLNLISAQALCFETTNTLSIENLNVIVNGNSINVPVIISSVDITNNDVNKKIKKFNNSANGFITDFICDNSKKTEHDNAQKNQTSAQLTNKLYTIGSYDSINNIFKVLEYQFFTNFTIETNIVMRASISGTVTGDIEFELSGGSTKDYGPVFTLPGQGGSDLENKAKQKARDDADCLNKVQPKNKSLTFTILEIDNIEMLITVPIKLKYNLVLPPIEAVSGNINDPRPVNSQYYKVPNQDPKLLKDFPNDFKPNRYFTMFSVEYVLSTNLEDLQQNINNSNLTISFNTKNIKVKNLPNQAINDIANILSQKIPGPNDKCCCVKWKLKNDTFSNTKLEIKGKPILD